MTRSFIFSLAVAGVLGLSSASEALVPLPRPMPRPPGQWVWVEPVYRVEYVRVWVAERVERVPSQYWVSPTYGWRTVIYCDEYGREIQRREWGEITPGRWEVTYREVVVAGRWETRERRVLVREGYWKRVGPVYVEPPVVIDPPIIRPLPVNPRSVGVEGYAKEWEQDKGKFSPLYEWPK